MIVGSTYVLIVETLDLQISENFRQGLLRIKYEL